MKWFLLVICISLLISNVAGYKTANQSNAAKVISEPRSCPVWTTTTQNNTCECGVKHVYDVRCTNGSRTVTLPNCYCMSRNKNDTVIGYCAVSCYTRHNRLIHGPDTETKRYKILVSNDLNETKTNRLLCHALELNRVGQMCGRCEEGYALPVYSYNMTCIKCSNYKFNWLRYIAIAYLPLTVFYISMILFRISVTSARVNGYITTCQILTIPNNLRSLTAVAQINKSSSIIAMKFVCTFYGIWNLDFFRCVYTPFCIHPRMSTLQTLALDYAIAVYPLLLVVLTYILVTLHDHYIVVVRLWRPFYKCFRFFRNAWDIKTFLVGAFATFILLSYVKILNTSLDILTPVALFDMKGTKLKQQYLRIDGTIEYFGKEHLPYALLAIVMCFLLNFLPLLLLCLHPCRCFQKCMEHFNIHSQIVHTFVEVFQGCFKTHPRDFRLFAAFYIVIRVVNVCLSSLVTNSLYFPFAVIVMALATVAIAVSKPYQSSQANNTDVILFIITMIAFFRGSVHTRKSAIGHGLDDYRQVLNLIASLLFSLHFLYGIVILIDNLQPKKLKKCYSHIYKKYILSKWNSSPEEPDIPHRLRHPDHPEYAPLIAEEAKHYNE